MTMRFYRGDESHHHDLALVPDRGPGLGGRARPWSMEPMQIGVNHVAIAYPDRDAVAEPARAT